MFVRMACATADVALVAASVTSPWASSGMVLKSVVGCLNLCELLGLL